MKKALLASAGWILCILIFLATVAAGLSYLCGIFTDENLYAQRVVNEKYVDQLETILIDRLESDSLYYDVPIEYIKGGVNREELTALSKEYVTALVRSFKNGTTLPKAAYDSKFFEDQIRKYLADYPEIGQFYEEETVLEIADEFTLTVDNTLNTFINIGLIEKMARTAYSNKYVTLLSNSIYLIIGMGLICAGLFILLCRKPLLWCAYRIFGSVWCGSVVIAIPAYLIYKNDFLSKLILEEGPFKTLLGGIYSLIMDSWISFATILFAVASVLLFAFIIVLSIKKNKETVEDNEEN